MDDLFLGTRECRLDDRGRLRLPAEMVARHAEDGGGRFVLQQGLDKCLVLYPLSTWKREAKRIRQLDNMIPEERQLRRMFFQTAKDVTLDGNSRFQMPGFLADYAAIDRDVVIVGVDDRYEIWDVETHRHEMAGLGSMAELASKVFSRRGGRA